MNRTAPACRCSGSEIAVDDGGGRFKQSGICEVLLETLADLCKIAAGADTFVHNDAHGDAALEHDFAVLADRDLTQIAHGDEYARCAEFVNVMINVVRADARKVRDTKTDMERTGFDDLARKQTVLIEQLEQTYAEVA